MVQAPQFSWRFLLPQYWLLWLGVALLWLISWLPYSVLMWLGQCFGRLLYKVLKSRAKVARRNIELCFPHLSESEREDLVRRNFDETGKALFDTIIGWWWPSWRFGKLAQFQGYQHIQAAQAEGKGVLLLAAHFLHLEAACRVFGLTHPGVGFYRPHNNPLMDYLQYHGRNRANKYMIGKRDVKGLIAALNQGEVCFYLPDQDYGRNRSEFVPFFAVPDAATTTGTLLFANAANCVVLPIITSRRSNNAGYEVEVLPALSPFPTGDDKADVTRVNKWVEQAVLRQPEQYMWLHRRFKTRPDAAAPSLYKGV
ncbi:MAG: LpxL/LpxP family Kdo(2)-lipid IV(A) lauroyl/palmitoleoyl acyltransferase [Gammaproteobacteria bacterium]|nr:LpxL/LpxP family Kdo(2)-lipid IV(A) lauroyl/palmitoleoyl acyltransferase [Gammaproteobacteria bacterium]MBU1553245.1 LpxL/LpxP family Kdo(2)-lipid IV(A) lauroyl/palmitoleoyl acyltransferase [Gammaproteobacteria bacterium]MBU2069016.1 LpxL/LpxP family Kdo(2)-lipid IV(A) lauroyl/palmitoleoyl acyltransferase [Gammaproteobacteria bacterium]MBU2183239.1 LpxL/LpxP family Kdo(2)-lipid IV(A) lauroyl/palmitoleoyl acyltransferase [Gammaproteobacteria bacterium]MBU2204618.1 LpxL/LpxP family Kdo(2)-lipi